MPSSTGDGPWRNRLTEDQDLGLRLLAAGWKSRQEMRAVVEQQGVPRAASAPAAAHALGAGQPAGLRPARRDVALAIPAVGSDSARSSTSSCRSGRQSSARHSSARSSSPRSESPRSYRPPRSFPRCTSSASRIPCSAAWRRATPRGAAGCESILIAHLYAIYTWLLFPVLLRALVRQMGTRREWSRTDRVPLEPVAVTTGCGSGSRGIARSLGTLIRRRQPQCRPAGSGHTTRRLRQPPGRAAIDRCRASYGSSRR